MTNEQLGALASLVGVYVILFALILIQSYRLAKSRLETAAAKDRSPLDALARESLQLREENQALRRGVHDLNQKAQETELFTRLSLEMGMPLPDGDPDDTIPVHDA